jgi:hypothetical protein
MKIEQIECSETSAYKIQTPGNHPEENIQHTEHGESLKSKIGLSGSGKRKTAGSRARDTEPLDSIKLEAFLDQQRNYQLVKTDSVS